MIKLILIIFALIVILVITAFIQGILFITSFTANKKEILDELKKYDEKSYGKVINKQVQYTRQRCKLVYKLCKDRELKYTNKILYYYVKRYKIFLFELVLFVFLIVLSSIIIQVFGKRVN